MIRSKAEILTGTLFVFFILGLPWAVSGQTKTRKTPTKKPAKVVKKAAAPAATPEADEVAKKNGSSTEASANDGAVKVNKRGETAAAPAVIKGPAPTYFYYFAQPDFVISSISIDHDDAGLGKITFMKKDMDESITDPVQISPAALERINASLTALNFFDSNENYQYEKDYSHLGNVKLKIKRGAKERTVAYNYTTNKDAKTLADEYRKIANQAIWLFDINVSRVNQPLESPKLLDVLDSYIRRDEISDQQQILPFLQELSNDERLPLIARNHAAKLAKNIEKQTGKK
jgi:hypothetical protein